METTARQHFQQLSDADLLVNSGVYDVVLDGARTQFDARGLPSVILPDRALTEAQADLLLSVSAFSRTNDPEHSIADHLYGVEPGVRPHPILGYYTATYAGAVTNDEARARSSSGGLTTWLLTKLLNDGLIDGVIHMKQSESRAGNLFEYALSRTTAEIEEGAKTRYYPGELSESLKTVLDSDGRYAIVGIPSVLYEVRLAAMQNPDLAPRIPYYIGLVCGHQKSKHYADALAWQVGIEPGQLQLIDFRKKLEGARASEYGVEFQGVGAHGEMIHEILPASALYGTDWGLGTFKPNFSDLTEDIFNETADVVFGDAWLPEYLDDSRGHNIVVARTQEIKSLFVAGVLNGELQLDELPPESIVRSQAGLVRHGRELLPARREYMNRAGEFVPAPRLPLSTRVSFPRSRIQQLRVQMSRRSHSAFNEAVDAKDFNIFKSRMRPLVRQYQGAYKTAATLGKIRRRLR